MISHSAGSTDADPHWERRWLLLASNACILFAVIVLIATQPTRWNWPLLVWGMLVGIVGAATIELVAVYSLRGETPASSKRSRWNRRRLIYDGSWIFFGAVIGLAAAAFDLAWMDIGVTAWAFACLCAGACAYLVARRRAGPQP